MRKKKTDILDDSWNYIKWILIVVFIYIIIASTGVFYISRGYGISNGDWDVLTVMFFSNLIPLKEGRYADYYDGEGMRTHKIEEINGNEITTITYFGSGDTIDRSNVYGVMFFEIPIIRFHGKEGFMVACHYSNLDTNNNCDYLYCKGVLKRSQEDCEK